MHEIFFLTDNLQKNVEILFCSCRVGFESFILSPCPLNKISLQWVSKQMMYFTSRKFEILSPLHIFFFFFEGKEKSYISSSYKESFENLSRYAAPITSNILKAPEIIARRVYSSNVLLLLPLIVVLYLDLKVIPLLSLGKCLRS